MHFTWTQELARWGIAMAGMLVVVLGSLHLLFTGWGRRLHPADPTLIERLRLTPPRLTRETDLWRCWIGFNASHGLGVVGYGLMLAGLSILDAGLFARHPLLAAWALAMMLGYLLLARRYWFSTPRRVLWVALALLVAGLAAAGWAARA